MLVNKDYLTNNQNLCITPHLYEMTGELQFYEGLQGDPTPGSSSHTTHSSPTTENPSSFPGDECFLPRPQLCFTRDIVKVEISPRKK